MNAVEETLRIPCSIESVHTVREGIRRLAKREGLGTEDTDDLVLAVHEATTNAIRYGCPTGGQVRIRWKREGDCIRVEISDTGRFRKRIPLPDLDDTRGRGIPLMIALVDELHIREGTRASPGTVVRLTKCVD